MSSWNNQTIKGMNRLQIMMKVSQNTDINRLILSEKMGLTTAAITKIINPMIDEGFLAEESYVSTERGRKGRYIRLSSGVFSVAAVRITRTAIHSALLDLSGEVLACSSVELPITGTTTDILFEAVSTLLDGPETANRCLGVVMISPGARKEGAVTAENPYGPYFWDFSELRERVDASFGLPLWSENDSNALLRGELWFGAGRDAGDGDTVVLYNIGAGIGASCFMNGEMLRGSNDAGVEIGHTTVDFNGPRCSCGNTGCLELYAGLRHWDGRVKDLRAFEGKADDLISVFGLAEKGDADATGLILRYARTLSIGACTLISMFSPKRMIIGLNEADGIDLDMVIRMMDETVRSRNYTMSDSMEMVPFECGRTGYFKGAIPLALEKIFGGRND